MPIVRGFGGPLLQIGDLAFDCELTVERGGEREMTERRIASGALVSDHSRRMARTFEVSGAVSALPQPQNLGRPGSNPADAIPQLPLALAGVLPIDFLSRREDFEQRLDAMLDDDQFAEVELVSKVVGRVNVVMTRWRATNTPDDGDSATYSITLREVLRASDLTIAFGIDAALALNGSGGAPLPGGGGSSQATPGVLEVVP